MGTIEAVRKVVQDLVAPDLKAIIARLETLVQKMKHRADHAEKVELERFAAAEKMSATRQETLTATMAANHITIMNYLEMDKRLSRLESARGKTEPSHA